MSQEMNKKAVADLFCIEDARAVCEAIGGLGLNPGDENTDEPLEYTPDNILDVTVNENPDGMPAFPQVGQSEMDNETKAFVADELAKQLMADGRESLSEEDLIPFMVKIKGENHISQDLTSFIDQLTSGADARLSTQNTSEAQPNGVASDLTNGGESATETAVAAPVAEELPPEAPGGIAEPAEEPALATNADDAFSLDVPAAEPAAEGEFNLDVPEPAAEDAPAEGDSFTLDVGDEAEPAPAEDTADTIGELDFGDDEAASEEKPAEEENGSSEEDDLFSALDGMSDEALDDGKDDDEKGDDEKPAEEEKPVETESVEDEQAVVTEEPVSEEPVAEEPVVECGDKPADEPMVECGDKSAEEPMVECGDKPAEEPMVECGDAVDAKLESIKDRYVDTLARDRVRAVVESYERKRAIAEKQALCESIINGYKSRKAEEARQAMVESTMGEKISELGDKVSAMCESTAKAESLEAKFESILSKFKQEKAEAEASKNLDAKLESILEKTVASKEADKKLAAIVESVKTPAATAEVKKGSLDAKLESIIADAKKKIAEAK